MTIVNTPWPYLGTAAFITLMGIYTWKQFRRSGNRYFGWLLVVWMIAAVAAAFSTLTQAQELRYRLWVLETCCALLAPSLELLFALSYTGKEKYINWRNQALLALPALIFVLLAFVNPTGIASFEIHSGFGVVVSHDTVRAGLFIMHIAIWLINFTVLIDCMQHAPAFRVPILWILLGQIVPRIAFVTINQHLSIVPPIQIVILITNFTLFVYATSLYSFRLLRVVPVARDKALQEMPYPLLVLDSENFLVDFNPAAQMLPKLPGKLTLRRSADIALGEWWGRISGLIRAEPASQNVVISTGTVQQHFHIRSLPLFHVSGKHVGQMFVFEDVTLAHLSQRRQAQTLWAQASLKEREQLAHELHDGLSQNLAFLNMQAQAALIQIETGQVKKALANLTRLSEATGQIQEDTRELISNLLFDNMPMENFSTAVQHILLGFKQQTGLEVRLDFNKDSVDGKDVFTDPSRLPPSVAVQLIRMIQEALTNVRKHARSASQVSVELKSSMEYLFITVKDDGPGFDPVKLHPNGKHFGLQVMNQRAERIGGQVKIYSEPGKGVSVQICIPTAVNEIRSKG